MKAVHNFMRQKNIHLLLGGIRLKRDPYKCAAIRENGMTIARSLPDHQNEINLVEHEAAV